MFKRAVGNKSVLRRSKLWALVGVFLVAGVVSPFLSSGPAYADTTSDIHDIIYKHYAATYLRDCLFKLPNDKKNKIYQAAVDDPNTFFSGGAAGTAQVSIGLYFEPTDGVAGCTEGGLVQTALTSLGYGDNPGKLLTDIGYTAERVTDNCNIQGIDCENGTRVAYIRPASGDNFNSFFARALGKIPDYAQYVAYAKIFNSKCSLIEPPTGNGSAVTYKKAVLGDNGKYSAVDTKAEFAVKKITNGGSSSNQDTGKVPPIQNYDYDNGKSTSINCRDLLAKMDGLINGVVAYNNDNKDDPIAINAGTDTSDATCTADPNADGCDTDDQSTCNIPGVGWIICPTMNFIAGVNDNAFSFLASNFLSVDSEFVTHSKDAWAKFRDIANILFVIAMLVVVYSQLTSVGLTNYGIKKLLPKIVIAAILVNTSFIICQLAVDLSNIVGYGIASFFGGLKVGTTEAGADMASYSLLGEALKWTLVIGSILIAGAGILLAVSVPVILAALLALGLIVLILIARKALIVLMIVIAPLAFVAYLLPNTEQWFKKWLKAFSSLLLLFPIIGLVFGASQLAGVILGEASVDNDGNITEPLMALLALATTALPLFIVPSLLKSSLSAFGALGSKLSGWADKAGGKIGGKVRDTSMLGAYKKQYDRGKEATRAQILGGSYKGKNPFTRAASGMSKSLNNSRLSGKIGNRMAASGAATAQKLRNEDVENEMARMLGEWGPNEELSGATEAYKNALIDGDVTKARAAQKILLGKGNAGISKIQEVIESGAADSGNDAVQFAKGDLASAGLKSKNAALNAWSYDSAGPGGVGRSFSDVKNDADTYRALTDEEFVTQSDKTMEHARSIPGGLDKDRADRILGNKDLQGPLNDKKYAVLRAASGGTPPAPSTPPSGGGSGGSSTPPPTGSGGSTSPPAPSSGGSGGGPAAPPAAGVGPGGRRSASPRSSPRSPGRFYIDSPIPPSSGSSGDTSSTP